VVSASTPPGSPGRAGRASQTTRGGRATTIKSLATYVPPRLLTNANLEQMVDTTDEWIQKRTGIRESHIVDAGVATSDLGREAAITAIARAGLRPDDIDLIIVGTVTPDMLFPSTACLIQHKIGARHAWGFDLSAACSAFTYAITTASQMVATGAHEHALVIGADVMSSIIDYRDRSTCVLFGDGAGAVVVGAAHDGEGVIVDFEHEIDGSGGLALCMPAGGSARPASHESIDMRLHYVKQDGHAVFKFAVRKTEEIARRLLGRNGIAPDDLDLFVSHQANRRIIESASEKLGIDPDRVIINIERFGNTTGGTIPLALNDAVEQKRLKEGDLLLLASVGAGFTVGTVLMRWGLKQ
jgi:3-oxoacyl-[acyl-carrier-protein] synthase-3